ncbi:methionine adenosyltransferase domain-containing protein [Patescibacteria group bacterium]|nr:methionine adenosyltransferase domain-containing protein [Patescibacteria group bacterium]
MTKTCEFVSPKHPDKICDFIADSILDAFLAQDPESRVAIEVMGGHKAITISGEVTSRADVDMAAVASKIVGTEYKINVYATHQSEFIAHGVDMGGAGDQGVMIGHAVSETPELMPREYVLARDLCRAIYEKYPYDGKVQVTLEGEHALCVVASFQNTKTSELEEFVRQRVKAEKYLINPAGEWSVGGFDADSGLSGRKLIIDNYGPEYQIGGGSFSGKDYTKVDRSGAYMARKIAVDYLKKRGAKHVQTKLAYAIGVAQPVMAQVIIDGAPEQITGYDLSPAGIKKALKLDTQSFAQTSKWGHFGRGFEWDK